MRRTLLTLLAGAAVLLAGCGNDRTPVPELGLIPAPKGFRDAPFQAAGRAVPRADELARRAGRGRRSWRRSRSATRRSGSGATSAPSRCPRRATQLAAARQALVAQIESRDPTFKLTSTRLVIKPGFRGVEVVGVGTNLTNESIQRSMRSLHAYGHGVEVVMDAFAPPREFARVDEQTFGPMARSLRLSAPRASGPDAPPLRRPRPRG